MLKRTAILISLSLLAACDYVASEATERLYSGTVKAVESCMSRNQSELVDSEAIRRLCVGEHEQRIFAEVSGSANFRSGWGSETYFSGSVINKSSNHIVTAFEVTVEYGGSKQDSKSFSGYWITPGNSGAFTIPTDELTADVDHSTLGKGEWAWNLTRIYGLEITLD